MKRMKVMKGRPSAARRRSSLADRGDEFETCPVILFMSFMLLTVD
jgi:hypothetical protein